ncbi:10476_t:CDS:2, partial [Gigaspora rosea]
KKLDGKIQKILRKASFKPSKEELAHLKEGLDQTWESIEAAIIAAARKTVPYAKMRMSEGKKQHKTATIKAAIALEIQINNVSHTREELEDWLTEVYAWHKALEGKLSEESERAKNAEIRNFIQKCAEMIVSEQKKILTSLLDRPYNK